MGPTSNDEQETFERRVADAYRALGANVVRSVDVRGAHVDVLVEEVTSTAATVRTAVECDASSRRVGVRKIRDLTLSFRQLVESRHVDLVAVVSRAGFTNDARASAAMEGIRLLEIEDLEAQVLSLRLPTGDRAPIAAALQEESNSGAPADHSATENVTRAPRTFISYSHDSNDHKRRVIELSDRLRSEGVDCDIDQYPGGGNTGWPDWMRIRIDWADFVIVVCTGPYLEKATQPIKSGVRWEALIINQELYESGGHNEKYLPVVFDSTYVASIPPWLSDYTYYDLSAEDQYEALYRVLTNQPAVPRPPLGTMRVLEPIRAVTQGEEESQARDSHWGATLHVQWTGEGSNARYELGWSPGAGFEILSTERELLDSERLPLNAITVTYGAGRILRFDTVAPLRLTDVSLRMPDGSIRRPDGKGGGLPLDEWFAEFKEPP